MWAAAARNKQMKTLQATSWQELAVANPGSTPHTCEKLTCIGFLVIAKSSPTPLNPDCVCSRFWLQQVDAADSFKKVKVAYETLADDDRRAEYDALHGTRRMNFFRDVDFGQEEEQQQGWGRPADPFEVHR